MKIEFNGKTVETKHGSRDFDLNDIEIIKNGYFNENKNEALKQLNDVLFCGKFTINKIYSYYFERVASKTTLYHSKFSIYETLQCDELIQVFLNKIKSNPKVFNSNDIIKNFKTAIRLGGKGITAKPSNFPLKECYNLLKNYINEDCTKNKIYIDTSCGWGVRLLASAILDINYVGFDVNSELIDKLNELGNDIKKLKPNWNFIIFKQGSQYLNELCIGKADIILTSPPYFNLEDYGNNKFEKVDSIHGEYKCWLDNYVDPLMKNIKLYLKNKKLALINVKNFKDYTLEEDFIKYGVKYGLKYCGYTTLKNNQRINDKGLIDNSEKVLIFKK